MNPHKITADFEKVVAEYCNAPFAVALDNCSNALFLSLMWWKQSNVVREIIIPSHTYMSVPNEIIHAGFKVKFKEQIGNTLTGEYNLQPTNVWDSALRFTSGMYRPGQLQCLSFTGPLKHLKLSKGGMILTDDISAYKWFKRMRFSGRRECSYHEDDFDMLGYNFYMMPEIAARGLLLMSNFPENNTDLCIPYPDLGHFKIYQQ